MKAVGLTAQISVENSEYGIIKYQSLQIPHYVDQYLKN